MFVLSTRRKQSDIGVTAIEDRRRLPPSYTEKTDQRRDDLHVEGWGKEGENCTDLALSVIAQNLKLKEDDFNVVSAYRVGKRQHQQGPRQLQHRLIFVSFWHPGQINQVMKNALKLKGSKVSLNRDHPREIQEARKALWHEFKANRDRFGAKNERIKFPAALVVNGQTIRDLFPNWNTVLAESRITYLQRRFRIVNGRCGDDNAVDWHKGFYHGELDFYTVTKGNLAEKLRKLYCEAPPKQNFHRKNGSASPSSQ
ncbi:hypothetical protein MAR_012940 [Mya arenaria]|uniref:Uncharacterized protein n=1 Tax=Mya arenaria TaxID=6604 RepID=A0ABY7G7K3_MYAAR|nr:hypothetical protein MAR_012940 [Mya arenaria]